MLMGVIASATTLFRLMAYSQEIVRPSYNKIKSNLKINPYIPTKERILKLSLRIFRNSKPLVQWNELLH